MVQRLLEGPWEALKRRFPDRQIYHRSDGHVRYFAISTQVQVAAIALGCLAAAWTAIATANMIVNAHERAQQRQRVAAMEARYEQMLEEARAAEAAALAYVESRTENFDRAAGRFQVRHDMLSRLLDFADELQGGGDMQSPGLEGGRILMAATPADPYPRTAITDPTLPVMGEDTAQARVSALVAEQDAVLAEAENSAEARLENLRAVVRLTGLRVDELMDKREDESDGEGGPFIPVTESGLFGEAFEPGDPFNARVARLASRVSEAESLERMLEALPLGQPVDGPHRLTSNYGVRMDPFTRRPAFHAGKDFAGPRGTPIVAPAPGRVVYAGWRAGYGRTVEIDHGYGFRTRYGHLQTIGVRRGDQVILGQKIGGMGSTGRSTATHLHYEVWFDDAHADPDRFLRAGRYVH